MTEQASIYAVEQGDILHALFIIQLHEQLIESQLSALKQQKKTVAQFKKFMEQAQEELNQRKVSE